MYTQRFKDVRGTTYEQMLARFDMAVIEILEDLIRSSGGIMNESLVNFHTTLCQPGAMQGRRDRVLKTVSRYLQEIYEKPVVVLIDEYDSPMHSAIEHGYFLRVRSFSSPVSQLTHLLQASEFFAVVFGSLLKVC